MITKKKILVIEDEEMVRDGLVDLLTNDRYEVKSAENGEKGLELARQYFPDLILCDIMMPGIDGYKVLELLHKDDAFVMTPFIFLTAKSERDNMREGMSLGADDYISKPFKAHELVEAIDARFTKEQIIKDKSESKLNELRLAISTILPHEFRTPLNGILGSSQLLLEYSDTMDKEEIKTLYENINLSATRLNKLIINYLFYTELELLTRDKKRLAQFQTDSILYEPSKSIIEILNIYSKKNNRENDLKIDLNDASIRIHTDHFQKIIEEITDNAFKFSKQGQLISVNSITDSSYYKIIIRDNGRGIHKKTLSDIGAFVQFDRKIYEQQGSGLGLIIAYKLLQIYNGKFKIDSNIDQFTEITLAFPIIKTDN